MIAWILYTMLTAAIVGAAALAAEEAMRLLRRPRRWTWAVAMAAAAGLPLAARFLPDGNRSTGGGQTIDPLLLAELLSGGTVAETSAGVADAILASRAADPLLLSIWLATAATMYAALLLTYRGLRRVRAFAERVEIAGVPALLTRTTGPMVVGVRRPEVVVPRWISGLSEEERRLVVRHEWEHVQARDTRLLLASAILVAAMPWNLPLWWMRRRLRQALEVDCDARVLAAGADCRVYGRMLIQTAGRPRPTPLLAPALVELPSLLERRIVAMTSRTPPYRAARVATAATVGALLFVAACELTPRGGAPSPTEPTLADVLEPEANAEQSERVVIEVEGTDGAAPDVTSIVGVLDGDISVSDSGMQDSTVRMRVLLRPGDSPERVDVGAASIEGNPLILVDGMRVTSIDRIDRNRILEINVLKGPVAVAEYGEEGREGVIKITTGDPGSRPRARSVSPRPASSAVVEEVVATGDGMANGEAETAVGTGVEAIGYGTARAEATTSVRISSASRDRLTVNPEGVGVRVESITGQLRPLLLVDGKKVDSLDDIDPRTIDRIEIIKDATAVERYGARGRNGVIVVTLKPLNAISPARNR